MSTRRLIYGLLLLVLPLLFSASLTDTVSTQELNSFCGLTPYDIKTDSPSPNITRTVPRFYRTYIGNENYTPTNASQREWHPGPNNASWLEIRKERLERLKSEYVHVRLRILYDAAFEEEVGGIDGELQFYIRNMILDMQMRFEEPRMLAAVKFNFIVTKLEKLKYHWPPAASVEVMFETFNELQGKASDTDYDMTFILFYSHIHGGRRKPIYGAAPIGTFCNLKTQRQIVVANAHDINMALTLAHEFGHSLNLLHDSEKYSTTANGTILPTSFEYKCAPDDYMMSAQASVGRTRWSECSVNATSYYLTDEQIYKCVFDPQRMSNSRPLSLMFDFTSGSLARLPLPGEHISLDRQCQIGYGKSIKSVDRQFVLFALRAKNITTCDMVYCQIDSEPIELGPALTGSECWFVETGQVRKGKCMFGKCIVL